MSDLGTLGGQGSGAYGINNTGQVVGETATIPGSYITRAFLYSNGTMTDLGTLGGTTSWAYGINNTGQVVGYASTAGAAGHAFLYSNGVMSDLGTLGGTSSQALGINNNGQVVGWAYTAGGAARDAFVYSGGSLLDLNKQLSPGSGSGWILSDANAINDLGQIVGTGTFNGVLRAYLLTGTPTPPPPPPPSVPVPAAVWLFGSGLLGLIGMARRKRSK
jgi:probable HAF family extracellular repeat protein